MCTPVNQLDCSTTMTTIGQPDATFVAQKVGNDLQFRGITLSPGVVGVIAPDSMLIDLITPIGPPPPQIGVIGTFAPFSYSAIVNKGSEIPLSLSSAVFNTGTYALTNLNITTPDYYKVIFSPTHFAGSGIPQVTYRLRDASSNIFAEIYASESSTTNYSHILYLPVGVYNFTIQVLDLTLAEYNQFNFLESQIVIMKIN